MAYIAGSGYAKLDDPLEMSLSELVFTASSSALAAAGLQRRDVDGVCIAASDQLDGIAISSMVLAPPAGSYLKEEVKVSDESSLALAGAVMAIESRAMDRVLVVSWTKASESSEPDALGVIPEPIFSRSVGLHPFCLEAVACQRFMAESGLGLEPLARLAKRYSGADEGPIVSWPLFAGHIPPLTDAAVALVVTGEPSGVEIASVEFGCDHHDPTRRPTGEASLLSTVSNRAASRAGVQLDRELAIETTDRNVIRLCMTLSDMGLAERSRVIEDLLAEGIPRLNPSGGLWTSNPPVAAGLERVMRAAELIDRGQADSVLAHSSFGAAGQGQFASVLRSAR